jgi:hypothetical protein
VSEQSPERPNFAIDPERLTQLWKARVGQSIADLIERSVQLELANEVLKAENRNLYAALRAMEEEIEATVNEQQTSNGADRSPSHTDPD